MARFVDTYQDESVGAPFIKKNEKLQLIADSTEMEVLRVFERAGYEGKGRENVVVVSLDGEERALSFTRGTVFSRDRMLDEMTQYLEGEDTEAPVIRLAQSGNSHIIELVG